MLTSTIDLTSQVNFDYNNSFYFLKGNQASNLASEWKTDANIYTTWQQSNAPFWYGDGSEGTNIADMQDNYSTFYMVSNFTANKSDSIEEINLTIDYDDGFVIWINGEEALSKFAPSDRANNAFATDFHESGEPENYTIQTSELSLIEGENTLAIQGFNGNLPSSDFHFNLAITGEPKEPEKPETIDSLGVSIEHTSGFYRNAFETTISHPNNDLKILYTLDGSNPQTSNNVLEYAQGATIKINPKTTTNRYRSPGVILRVSVQNENEKPSKPITRSYLYLLEVANQGNPGGEWPNSNINGQVIKYNIDQSISNGSTYGPLMHTALTDIPTLSIATDLDNLFDPQTGIYVNADQQGIEWERDCSVELLDADEENNFFVNAGLRIRGGWSRHPDFPKHSFRLFFRSEYGNGKLKYPLFGDEGADEFDKIDLRCAQNYGWQNGSHSQDNTFLRDVFCRDAQADSGNPHTRSRYYHLYLNGVYWGVFMTQERAEARFAAEYMGGDTEDYDVVKISGEDYSKNVVATDGNLDAWQHIYEKCNTGFTNDEDYFYLWGKDKNGIRQEEMQVWVDMDNLIDYMINIFYSGNYDAPSSKFGKNRMSNNFYAIFNRKNVSEGFRFFVHDAEHSLGTTGGPGIGLEENRVNLGDLDDNYKMTVSSFNDFNPQWLHHRLTSNENYRIRFADRAQQQLTKEGILTPEANKQRMQERYVEVENAIIAESARWGGTHKSPAYNKYDDWIPGVQYISQTYFPQRTQIVIDQLKSSLLFSNIEAPSFYTASEEIKTNFYDFNDNLDVYINNEHQNAKVYYCVNGEDPRLPVGRINPNAKQTSDNASESIITSTTIKARTYYLGKWSNLSEVTFLEHQLDFSNFKVTELHYHPKYASEDGDTTGGKSYEFIEFKNTSFDETLNLSDLAIDSGVRYTFPKGSLLKPQQFYVVAAKPNRFYERYAQFSSGNFRKSFSNGSEKVVVNDGFKNPILSFTYSDSLPWPTSPDGLGPSLVSATINPTGDPNLPSYWSSSKLDHGSPFSDDSTSILYSTIDVTETFSQPKVQLSVYPNPTTDRVYINIPEELKTAETHVRVISLTGKTIFKGYLSQNYVLSLNQLNANNGVYFVIVESAQFRAQQKLIYLKR